MTAENKTTITPPNQKSAVKINSNSGRTGSSKLETGAMAVPKLLRYIPLTPSKGLFKMMAFFFLSFFLFSFLLLFFFFLTVFYVAQARPELMTLLPQLPKGWLSNKDSEL